VAIGVQLAAGIRSGQDAAVTAAKNLADAVKAVLPHSPAKVGPFSGGGWTAVKTSGEAVAGQFGSGIEEGTGSVVERAQALAAAVSDSLANGTPLSAGMQKQIADMQKQIQIEEDKLRVDEDGMPKGDRAGIKAQLAELKGLHDKLKLGADESKGSGKGDSMNEAAQMLTKGLASMLDAGKNFAMANVNQFEQDVGISGNGAVETIANTGISWMQELLGKGINGAFGVGGKGGDTHFHVNDGKDAMALNEHQQWKQTVQHTQR
jgi:hypothetical protein